MCGEHVPSETPPAWLIDEMEREERERLPIQAPVTKTDEWETGHK